ALSGRRKGRHRGGRLPARLFGAERVSPSVQALDGHDARGGAATTPTSRTGRVAQRLHHQLRAPTSVVRADGSRGPPELGGQRLHESADVWQLARISMDDHPDGERGKVAPG